jgi:uncharacterized protein YjdB
MNRNVFCFLLIVSFLTLASCDMATVLHGEKPPDTSVALSGITLNLKETDILVNGTVNLKVSYTPAEATNKNVTWDSDVKNIATVTNDGIVRGVSAGIAVITVTSKDGGHKDMCTVTVKPGAVDVTDVSLVPSRTTLAVGETTELTVNFTPANPTNKNIRWDSENKNIATVSNGVVIGVAVGTTGITVTTEDGNKQATCAVTVIPAAISVTFNSVTANGSATQTTTALTLDFSASIPNFSASDITLSGVSGVSKGTLTGNNSSYTLAISGFTSGGNLTVAISKAGFVIGGSPKTVPIYYNVSVTGVSLNKTTLPLNVGQSETLTATLTPPNASNKNVYWSSSAPNIATVTQSGLVTALSDGTAVITVTTEEGGKTANCSVSVTAALVPVTGVTLDKTVIAISVGGIEILTATVAPADASNKNLIWSSSYTAVATVSNGIVTGVSAGSAIITVITEDGGKFATCSVTVNAVISNSFVRIEGGTFTMGSPSNEPVRSNVEEQHQVTVSSFYMGKYEVTQAEYEAVMGSNPSYFYFKGSNLPVERVTFYDAVEFCNRLSQQEGLTPAYSGYSSSITCNWNANGYRLPTEAEWEYACRAGRTTPFSTGNNITTSQANYDGRNPYNNNATGIYRQTTTAVGSFTPNPWGLYDMHGNVFEWCWDWYGDYSSGAQTTPRGPESGPGRVGRGGSWDANGERLRSASRGYMDPSGYNRGVGFRLVRN